MFLARKKTLSFYWNSNSKSRRMGLHDSVCPPTCPIFKPKLLQFTEKKRKPILEFLSVLGNRERVQASCSLGPHPHLAAKADTHSGKRSPCPTAPQTVLSVTK